jgi:murein DD-endopeptidase MepM/ murein hydrolase activator NlpD
MKRYLCHITFFFFVMLTIVAGCVQSTESNNPTSIISSNTPEHTQPTQTEQTTTPQPTQTPTSILSVEDIIATLPTQTALPTENTSDPVSMTFPTQLPTDDLAWRPPLYEIPWAPGPHDHFYFYRPIAVNTVNWPLPNYRYGITFFGPDIVHTGIDIAAPRGTPVLAAGAGRVVWAGTGLYFGIYNPNDPYGLSVVIEHDFGYEGSQLYTVYGHMDRIDVTLGDELDVHDPIGIIGDTGFTTGPHLHFEIRVGLNNFFQTRNPELWIAPPQGWGILVGRILNERNGPIEKLEVTVNSLESIRTWRNYTYTMLGIKSDPYYQENFVIGDLPAGEYQVYFTYDEQNYVQIIEIKPGVVSFFQFQPNAGFTFTPPGEASDFTIP